ncbi:hypothetical protein OsI_23320 [Oryza sativa Indica Group]|uniref:Uncharacterized protein n=1 Tax=Oryza sativa subsp. indica TaxID=39946 RepID=B8B3J9_ORYSI|nr:hypothetical protein OsI_23320 [Oryza sativa Indica Group]
MRSLRILSTPTAQRSSAPFIAHCLPLPYLCSVQVVPGIPVSHPPPPSHRRSRLSSTSMGSLDLGAAQEDRRHSRRHTRSSSGFLLLPCRMGLLAGDLLPSHPQFVHKLAGIDFSFPARRRKSNRSFCLPLWIDVVCTLYDLWNGSLLWRPGNGGH